MNMLLRNLLQVLFIPRSRLNKLVDQSQLPPELGGMFIYNHDLWMENRMVCNELKTLFKSELRKLNYLKKNCFTSLPPE